jgi:hypothetical protein
MGSGSETSNSKHGIRNSKRFDKLTALSRVGGQYRITKIQMRQTAWRIFSVHGHHRARLFLSLGNLDFGFVSDFDIRISDLTMILFSTAWRLKHTAPKGRGFLRRRNRVALHHGSTLRRRRLPFRLFRLFTSPDQR